MRQKHETSLIRQTISVPFSYPVYFTHRVFDLSNPVLGDVLASAGEPKGKTAVFIDSGVHEACHGISDTAAAYLKHLANTLRLVCQPCIIPGGEAAKNGWEHVNTVIDKIKEHRLCRHSYIIAIGGGAFLDAVGFAAGIVHRGIRLIRMPTTTLSQDDSGVSVKNGINIGHVKNMLGTFSPPFAVINDFEFLTTLSKDLMLDGIAEAFKVAIIKDRDFFSFLSDNCVMISTMDLPVIEEAVRRCAEIHLEHISNSNDPFEFGVSRPLDFGHWSAHMLEGMSGYAIRHGQAVAAGIALDACYAWKQGLLNRNELNRILEAMQATGLTLFYQQILTRETSGALCILEGIERFREHLGGALSITLPQGIGNCVEVHTMELELVEECIQFMSDREMTS